MREVKDVPEVVADLTFTPARDGQATVPPGCWEEDRRPLVGEHLLVADAGAGSFEATITNIEEDGSLGLAVAVFPPTRSLSRSTGPQRQS